MNDSSPMYLSTISIVSYTPDVNDVILQSFNDSVVTYKLIPMSQRTGTLGHSLSQITEGPQFVESFAMINPKLPNNKIHIWKSEAMISLNLYDNAKNKCR